MHILESVFAANIYCHSTCFMQYIHLSKQSETKYGPPQTKPKHDLFVEALSYLDPLIKDGYGLTVTDIKDFVSILQNHLNTSFRSLTVRNAF